MSRATPKKPYKPDRRLAVTPQQDARGGHHPIWAPAGERITRNLKIRDGAEAGLDIGSVGYDGSVFIADLGPWPEKAKTDGRRSHFFYSPPIGGCSRSSSPPSTPCWPRTL